MPAGSRCATANAPGPLPSSYACAERLASGLARRLVPGARVALFMANRAEYLLLQCAIERAGLVRVPVNARSTAHEVGVLLADCEPAALFHDETTAERRSQPLMRRPRCGRPRSTREAAQGGPCYAALARETVDRELLDRAALDDLCSINYTSGTSGRPKGAMLSHRNWAAVYRNMLVDRDIRGDDVLAHVGPLTHSSGTYFVPWFLRGATSIVVEGGSIDGLLAAIARHKVTAFTCVPTVLTRIVNHPDIDRFDVTSLRTIGYGAEPIPRNTLDKALARFGPILVQNYGQTEAMMTLHQSARVRTLRSRHERAARRLHRAALHVRRDRAVRARRPARRTGRDRRDRGALRPRDAGLLAPAGGDRAGAARRLAVDRRPRPHGRERADHAHRAQQGDADLRAATTSIPRRSRRSSPVARACWRRPSSASRTPTGARSPWRSSRSPPMRPPTPDEIGARVKPRLGIKTPKRIEVVAALPKTANGKVDKRALRERLAAGAA